MWNLVPILQSLVRHKSTVAIILLEISLTFAIVCNALYAVSMRFGELQQASGIAEQELLLIDAGSLDPSDDADARTADDLRALRALPGVRSATAINQVPFFGTGSDSSVSLSPEQERPSLTAAMYLAGRDGLATLGLALGAGRDFRSDEFLDLSDALSGQIPNLQSAVILTQTTAQRLFDGEDAVGKVIYMSGIPLTIVGVVEQLAHPYVERRVDTYSMILPIDVNYQEGVYLVRAERPEAREALLAQAVESLQASYPNRLIVQDTSYEALRKAQFQEQQSMVWLLLAVCAGVLAITALGIVGLTSFWVTQRTRQIGVRRALGASRAEILSYFRTENFLITSAGVLIGIVLTYGLNHLLMLQYAMPRLPLLVLPFGAVALWVVGQLAALGPALRGASVAPAAAARAG